jgi:hypothetical protein
MDGTSYHISVRSDEVRLIVAKLGIQWLPRGWGMVVKSDSVAQSLRLLHNPQPTLALEAPMLVALIEEVVTIL